MSKIHPNQIMTSGLPISRLASTKAPAKETTPPALSDAEILQELLDAFSSPDEQLTPQTEQPSAPKKPDICIQRNFEPLLGERSNRSPLSIDSGITSDILKRSDGQIPDGFHQVPCR